MKKIRVLIIDDERSARNEVRRLVTRYQDFEIIAEARDADEAQELIAGLKPDLIFLDIQMPGRLGFELLEALEHVPQVIFVSAFDHYALKAFEVSALDYLLKPVRVERFDKAVALARERLQEDEGSAVFVKDRTRYFFIRWKDVYLIESLDNYARLHFGQQAVLIKSSLNQLEAQLEKLGFFRVNRAQLINKGHIKEIIAPPGGQAKISLRTGETVELSERQWTKFRKINAGS